MFRLMAADKFWLILFLTVGTAFLFDFVSESLARIFFPMPTQVYLEAERLGYDLGSLPRPPAGLSLQQLNARQKHKPAPAPEPKKWEDERRDTYTGADFSHTPNVRAFVRPVGRTASERNVLKNGDVEEQAPPPPPGDDDDE